jgi:hypothetical protein
MRFLDDTRLYSDTEACVRFLQAFDGTTTERHAHSRRRYHFYWHGRFGRKQTFAPSSRSWPPMTPRESSCGSGWTPRVGTRPTTPFCGHSFPT